MDAESCHFSLHHLPEVKHHSLPQIWRGVYEQQVNIKSIVDSYNQSRQARGYGDARYVHSFVLLGGQLATCWYPFSNASSTIFFLFLPKSKIVQPCLPHAPVAADMYAGSTLQ